MDGNMNETDSCVNSQSVSEDGADQPIFT